MKDPNDNPFAGTVETLTGHEPASQEPLPVVTGKPTQGLPNFTMLGGIRELKTQVNRTLSTLSLPRIGETEIDEEWYKLWHDSYFLVKAIPWLDLDLIRSALPLHGSARFAELEAVVQEFVSAYRSMVYKTKIREVDLRKLFERHAAGGLGRTNETPTDLEAVTRTVHRTVSGIWTIARPSRLFQWRPGFTGYIPSHSRLLHIVELLSFLCCHYDHPFFSELVRDPKTGVESMKVKVGIFLYGIKVDIPIPMKIMGIDHAFVRQVEWYLRRSDKLSKTTDAAGKEVLRYGWEVVPLLATTDPKTVPPLVVLAAPSDEAKY